MNIKSTSLNNNDAVLKEDQRYLSSVEKGFRVLDAFSGNSSPISLTDIAKKTHLPIPTLQRLTSTLVEAGYLHKDLKSKRYRLTVETVDLLYSYLSHNDLANQSWPHLVNLREKLGLDISLSVPKNNSMIYMHRLPGYPGNFENTLPGKKIPLHYSASGRCVLAKLTNSEIEEYITQTDIEPLTPWSITSPEELANAIFLCRDKGYALIKQEATPGLMTLSCPVIRNMKVVAGVSVHVPTAGTDIDNFVDKVLMPVVLVTQALGK